MVMMSLFFTPERIQAKERVKFNRHTGKAYTPNSTTAFEQEIAYRWQAKNGNRADYEGAVEVAVYVKRSLPKSASRKRIGEADTHKPDADNILKIVMDALNKVAYKDDKQVVSARVMKLPLMPYGNSNSIDIFVTYLGDDSDEAD